MTKPKLEDFPHPQGGHSTLSFHNALIDWQEREIERLRGYWTGDKLTGGSDVCHTCHAHCVVIGDKDAEIERVRGEYACLLKHIQDSTAHDLISKVLQSVVEPSEDLRQLALKLADRSNYRDDDPDLYADLERLGELARAHEPAAPQKPVECRNPVMVSADTYVGCRQWEGHEGLCDPLHQKSEAYVPAHGVWCSDPKCQLRQPHQHDAPREILGQRTTANP